MSNPHAFTVEQAVAAQRALQSALGLDEETFPVEAFVGMISDEIEQFRASGKDDQAIIDIVAATTGKMLAIEDIRRFYATPEDRHRHGD